MNTQLFLVLFLFAAAVFYLVKKLFFVSKKKSCTSQACNNCTLEDEVVIAKK